MKSPPRAPLEMIQAQVILGALEVLFDVPAGAAQLQATGFGGWPMKMGQVIVIGFGITGRPVHHQPNPFQFAPGLAQGMLQEDLTPGESCPPGLPSGSHPGALLPRAFRDSAGQLRQRFGGRLSLTDVSPDPLDRGPDLVVPTLQRRPVGLPTAPQY